MLEMLDVYNLFVLNGIDIGNGTSFTREQVGNALGIAISIIALAQLVMGKIGRMFGLLIVAGFVWVVVSNPKGFLTNVGNLIKTLLGL